MTTGDRKEAFRKIQSHKSEIRKALGNRIGKQVRKVPELIFYLDEGQDHASRIDKILSDLDIPDADESTE